MGRPSFEVYPSEIALIVAELALARKKLGSWTKPERVRDGDGRASPGEAASIASRWASC